MNWKFAMVIGILLSAPVAAQTVPPGLDGFSFQVAENVPKREHQLIHASMLDALAYYERFGVRLSPQQRRNFITKIVNTGRGNQERDGGGGCCTSQSRTNLHGPRLFFDVGHQDWQRDQDRKKIYVAHEFTHGIQYAFGVKSLSKSWLSRWMAEGIAEYYAREILAGSSKSKRKRMERETLSWIRKHRVFNYRLEQHDGGKGLPHPGGIGYLAVIGLTEISPYGNTAPMIYMKELRKRGRAKAFVHAFGISLEEFYARFGVWQDQVQKGRTSQPVWSRL